MTEPIKLTEQESREFWSSEGRTHNMIQVEESGWSGEKYMVNSFIFVVDEAGQVDDEDLKYYSYDISRTGSYYTDWYYDYPRELIPVKKVAKTIYEWEAIAQ